MILTGKTDVLGENLSRCPCVHHKLDVDRTGLDLVAQRCEVGDTETLMSYK
jgi:hypothetical protein